MIKKLSAEQEAQIPVYRDTWINIGLSTDRVDFEEVKKLVSEMYDIHGLKQPKEWFFCQSPLEAFSLIIKKTGESVSSVFQNTFLGSHSAGWISFCSYFSQYIEYDLYKELKVLEKLAKSSGWISLYEDFVVIQDRPTKILFDDQFRTHSEVGPAIEYSDGFGIYIWHGTQIPDEWITDKENIPVEHALNWPNVEQRRCAAEIIGWNKVLHHPDLKPKIIDEDNDPEIGTLIEVEIPEIGKERFLRVKCGTGREFALPVPPDVNTAIEANAWTYDVDLDIIKNLEIRT